MRHETWMEEDERLPRALKLTPLHLQLMLHYYCVAEPYSRDNPEHANSKAVHIYRQELMNAGLIQISSGWSGFCTTTKGHVFVEMLLATPLPVQKWSAP